MQYITNQERIKYSIKQQLQAKGYRLEQLPLFTGVPLRVLINITMPGKLHECYLDDQVKALIDAAQGFVFANDFCRDSISASRKLGEEHRAEMVFLPLA